MTLAVLARFVRRYWRLPLQVAGVTVLLLVLFAALPFLPRPTMRVEAADGRRPSSTGVVESLRAQGVGAPFEAPVERVAVEQGQAVKKGDLLFRMDVRGMTEQLAAARSEVADARAGVTQAQQMRREDLQAITTQIASLKALIAREQSAAYAPASPVVEPMVEPAAFTGEVPEDGAAAPAVLEMPAVDTARLQQLQAELAVARQRLAEQDTTWIPVLQDARRRLSEANTQAARLQAMIAGADRRSPINGIVTRVDARPGHWLGQGSTAVRVDDPQGYRVVALVDDKARANLEPGKSLPLAGPQGPAAGKLEKIVSGWDKELFYYWVWVKPAQPARYWPGQQVQLTLADGKKQ